MGIGTIRGIFGFRANNASKRPVHSKLSLLGVHEKMCGKLSKSFLCWNLVCVVRKDEIHEFVECLAWH